MPSPECIGRGLHALGCDLGGEPMREHVGPGPIEVDVVDEVVGCRDHVASVQHGRTALIRDGSHHIGEAHMVRLAAWENREVISLHHRHQHDVGVDSMLR